MQDVLDRITKNPKFHEFIAMRSRYSIIMAIVSAAIYYGFILILAFAPKSLGASLSGGVTTLGMPVGVLIILSAFVLTGIYVRRANTEFDQLNQEIVEESK